MTVVVVVGAQWGDEGKAKVIDLLAEQTDWIIRYQGGCNAGHTVVRDNETFKFHLIPPGILYTDKTCMIGPGTVIAPEVLQTELSTLKAKQVTPGCLVISPRAHITFPHHIELDGLKEDGMGKEKIGTTRRGIGPTYEDKVSRIGLRVGDLLLPPESLKSRLELILEQKNPILTKVFNKPPLELPQLESLCLYYREVLEPFIVDTDVLIAQALEDKQAILLEGAQGTMLDMDHGTYPYVTSSNPTSGGACVGSGIAPRHIDHVVGVAKAYTTRVGEGPFPTELFDASGQHLAQMGAEFGTTTGRARRCGWFDAVAMKYAAQINGLDSIALTKLDVFEGLEELRLCTAYQHRETGERHETFPNHIALLDKMDPIYESFPGWAGSIRDCRTLDNLPLEAKAFLKRLELLLGVPLSMISVGPDKSQTIVLQNVFSPEKPQSCLVAY